MASHASSPSCSDLLLLSISAEELNCTLCKILVSETVPRRAGKLSLHDLKDWQDATLDSSDVPVLENLLGKKYGTDVQQRLSWLLLKAHLPSEYRPLDGKGKKAFV